MERTDNETANERTEQDRRDVYETAAKASARLS